MPVPALAVETAALDAVAALVRAAIPEADLPTARIYTRKVLAFGPRDDGTPAVVVARTPGSPLRTVKKIGRTDVQVPITVAVIDGANRSQAAGREGWAESVLRLAGARPVLPAECDFETIRLEVDSGVALDMSLWEQANLWWAATSFLFTARARP